MRGGQKERKSGENGGMEREREAGDREDKERERRGRKNNIIQQTNQGEGETERE